MFYIIYIYQLLEPQNEKKWKEKNKRYLFFQSIVRKEYEKKKSNTKAKTLINKLLPTAKFFNQELILVLHKHTKLGMR